MCIVNLRRDFPRSSRSLTHAKSLAAKLHAYGVFFSKFQYASLKKSHYDVLLFPGNEIYHSSSFTTSIDHTGSPSFAVPITNITVNVGREAILECRVNHLGKYKVGWLKAKDQTILALHKRVITHNGRIDVDHEENR